MKQRIRIITLVILLFICAYLCLGISFILLISFLKLIGIGTLFGVYIASSQTLTNMSVSLMLLILLGFAFFSFITFKKLKNRDQSYFWIGVLTLIVGYILMTLHGLMFFSNWKFEISDLTTLIFISFPIALLVINRMYERT